MLLNFTLNRGFSRHIIDETINAIFKSAWSLSESLLVNIPQLLQLARSNGISFAILKAIN